MKMAVYRQRTAMIQLDLANCFQDAINDDHIQLINLAVELDKPVLIGLSGTNAIIKPFKPGDDAHSFEALYDSCLTVADLHRMRQHDVKDPDHIPPSVYHVGFDVPIALVLKLACEIKARDNGELRSKIRHLEENSQDFNTALVVEVVGAFRKLCAESDAEVSFTIREATMIEPEDPEPPEWRFVDP